MRKDLFKPLAVLFCLLAIASPVSAQLTIRDNGNAELGTDPFDPATLNPMYYHWLDTVTVLKVFGPQSVQAGGARMTFGDTYLYNTFNVALGEFGNADTDQLWLHGKAGTYLTAGPNALDTVMYYDPSVTNAVRFNKDVHTSGVFVQSDERFKENVEPVDDVLSLLGSLEAVSYTLKSGDRTAALDALSSMPSLTGKAAADKEFYGRLYSESGRGSERYGFLAQNVKDVFPRLVHTDGSGYMYVDYIGLIPLLVQSINELQARIDELECERQETAPVPVLQSAEPSGLETPASDPDGAMLYQNAPNPWSSETVIRYRLPQHVATATIYIYDMQGAQLKSIPAPGRGESQVSLTASDLKAGMYLYALVADGKLIDSKQMILTK